MPVRRGRAPARAQGAAVGPRQELREAPPDVAEAHEGDAKVTRHGA